MALRFRTRLSLTISYLVFLTVAAMTIVLVGLLATNLVSQYEDTSRVLADLSGRNIEFGIAIPRTVLRHIDEQMVVHALMVSEIVAEGERGGASPDKISATLKRVVDEARQRKEVPLIDDVWVTDATGRVYIGTSGIGFTFENDPEGKGQSSEFMPLLESGAEPIIQDIRPRDIDGRPYKYVGVSGTDKPRIVLVGADAETLGRITRTFDLQSLIERFQLDNFRRMMLVDAEGMVVAEVGEDDRPDDDEIRGRIVRFCAEFLRGDQDTSTMGLLPDRGVVSRLRNGLTGEPYALFIQHRTSDNVQEILGQLVIVVMVGLAMLLFGVVVSIFISRGLSKPLVALLNGAQEFAKGNLNYRLYVKRKDEFQGLAQAYNTMAISLQEYMHDLERETTHRERLESEMRIASEVQQSLLPKNAPDIAGLGFAGMSKPSREVGGDFFDYIPMGDGRVAVAIGDATGKGLPAALLTTECASILRTLGSEIHGPAELLRRTNAEFYKRVAATHKFVTLLVMVFDAGDNTVRIASAGHPPAVLLSGGNGQARFLDCAAGYPLGIVGDFEYAEFEVQLGPGDTIVGYSDGLTDAQNFQRELYGEERILGLLKRLHRDPIDHILAELQRDAERHMNGKDAFDDMTIVAIRSTAAPAATASAFA